jgi:hypothetical protein
MATTILRNHSWLWDDGLDLSRTHRRILHAPHLGGTYPWPSVSLARVSPYTFITQQVMGNNVHEPLTMGAHVKCNAYQREWLRLSIAFNKLVKILLAVTKYKCIPTQLNKRSQIIINPTMQCKWQIKFNSINYSCEGLSRSWSWPLLIY